MFHFVISPFSTLASRCMSGNHTRHWGGGSDISVSRKMLRETFFCGESGIEIDHWSRSDLCFYCFSLSLSLPVLFIAMPDSKDQHQTNYFHLIHSFTHLYSFSETNKGWSDPVGQIQASLLTCLVWKAPGTLSSIRAHLLCKTRPCCLLRITEGGALENRHGQLENLPQKLVEMRVNQSSSRVRYLWKNIWEESSGNKAN